MLSEEDWNLLTRYVAGEPPPAERPGMEQWIHEDPDRQAVYAELREIWRARDSPVDVDRAWSRFLKRREGQGGASRPTEPDPRRTSRPLWPRRWGIPPVARAAVIVFLFVVGGILAHRVDREPFTLGSRKPPVAERRWEDTQSYLTGTGELMRLSLSDGTEVVLGVRSELRLASGFGVDAREVRIQGEAFFHVTPDPSRPFIVHTTESMTHVVGTGFSVSSRGNGTDIAVREGKVRITPLAADAEAVELPAGFVGRVLPRNRSVEVAPVDLDERLAWMEGRLIFRNAPLRDVLRELELWYAVSFRVEGADLPERRLNAFLEHPPLGELLTAIALAVDASYRVDGSVVSFSPRP
jgi:transmembrane sensor